MSISPEETFRREQLLKALAVEGASRCCYFPGAGNPEKWPESRCDCKYLPISPVGPVRPNSEQTGCCEIRAAYLAVRANS